MLPIHLKPVRDSWKWMPLATDILSSMPVDTVEFNTAVLSLDWDSNRYDARRTPIWFPVNTNQELLPLH